MAFTFQINNDVKFKHDEKLLIKAEENTPEIKHKTVKPECIAELINDDKKLGGYGIKKSQRDIKNLSSYKLKRDDSIILDFGNHYVGYFSIDLDYTGSPMDAPLFLRIKFAEVPVELAEKSSDYDGWLSRSWIQEEYIHLDELPKKLRLPRRYSFRYVEIKVMDTSPKYATVFLNPEVCSETSADYSKLKNNSVNDTELKNICDVSIRTLAECMQDVFEDGPKRDRRLWIGDLRLQALAGYATFDNKDIVKRCLYLFGAMPTEEGKISANVFVKPKIQPDDTFLLDYSLFFISVLYDYINAHPDDKEVLHDLYKVAKIQIDLTLKQIDENGRLKITDEYPVFVDWSNEFDKDTAGQAICIYALRQFMSLAEMMREKDLLLYKKILDSMISFSRKELYDERRHLFVSGKNKEYNIASQVWMILAKVMSEKESHTIMEVAIKELFPVKGIATPYMYHHVAEALFIAGMTDEAINLIKSYWGKMIKMGADTFWEAFDPDKPDYSPYGNSIVSSYCHAWGCTPVYLIKKYLI